MVSEKVTLVNASGLHIKPASVFAAEMAKYACDVEVVANGKHMDGKRALALVGTGVGVGSEIEISCNGSDEKEALAAAVNLVKSGLGE